MGLIGKVIRSQIEDGVREIVTELYKDFTRLSYQICPPGIDANPLPDDQGVIILIDDNPGKSVQIGVLPKQSVDKGEIRIYSRDANGNIKSVTHHKKDGEVETSNDNGSVILKADGDVEINGSDDNAVRYSKLKEEFDKLKNDFNAHTHPYNPGPSPSAQTGATAQQNSSDMSTAKINNVKVPA